MTWLEDIGTHLQTNSIGTLGTSIFYSNFDSVTQNCIVLIASAGQSPQATAGGDMKLKRPQLGVLVRNTSDDTAHDKAISIYDLLNFVVNTTIGSTKFKRIQAISEPFFVSETANHSYIYSVNFDVQITGE